MSHIVGSYKCHTNASKESIRDQAHHTDITAYKGVLEGKRKRRHILQQQKLWSQYHLIVYFESQMQRERET